MLKVFKWLLMVCVVSTFGCEPYKEVDFQAEKCRQPPSGNIRITNKSNLRWDFDLDDVSNTVETEPIRIVWTIDGSTYAARRLSYQFDKRGDQKISVVMTNRCFMQTVRETTIKIN